MYVNREECEAAGLDAKEVERIAKGLSRYAKQADALGMEIFGGTGIAQTIMGNESSLMHPF
jgi:hypothetical protein